MRTYSHALLTLAAARRANPSESALWAALGATLPDLPAGLGAAWLWAKRRTYSREGLESDVCARAVFRTPDAALHSALPVAAALVLHGALAAKRRDLRRAASSLLLGWAAHVATDALTHGTDARPILWPLSAWRFESPISYRERTRHALPFTVVEHAASLAAVRLLSTSP